MDKEKTLSEIKSNVKGCTKCRLFKTARNPVPGEGDANAEIVFIGEAPGYYEDVSGRPFVGRAGKLLENFLGEIGYKREEVWIGNIIKHRPPDNRNPLPDEINFCKGYLELQLKTINPVLVITLGRFAMNYFYPEGKISRDRGNLIKVNGYLVYPVYHPAAALRSGSMMSGFREDFLRIPDVLKKAKNILEGKIEGNGNDDGQEEDGQLGLGL
ncbi:uracil-DNA glycosylase [Patescibacteria group bacterium]|nr:uracil-DNA glycosylase [Patescibacteria group bacterium]